MADAKKKKEEAENKNVEKSAPATPASAKRKKGGKKVKFLRSPTGLFNLAYGVGDTMEVTDPELLEAMLEAGVCTTEV